MNAQSVHIEKPDTQKLLGAANGDAALLYLYIQSGNDPKEAENALNIHGPRFSCAVSTLRQLGLWPEERRSAIASGERPSYSERDVLDAMDSDNSFRMVYGQVQRLLGRTLNTEELKILLSFERYLGLPGEVICTLVSYCKERARQKGSLRNPSLRTIEKEAYYWADRGIDSLEEAAAFIQSQNMRRSQMSHLLGLLQIRGRALTQAEERYAAGWLDAGFDDDAIREAYERTCLNTGGMNWHYMNKILMRWKEAGWLTAQQVKEKDGKGMPKGASGQLGQAELEALQRVLREG